MSVCAYFDCTSASLSLSGKRSQENGILTCQAAPGNASWRSIEGLSQRVRSSYVSFSDRHIWTPSEHIPAMHKRHRYKSRVAADYPDSKPDASYLGDLGYHPLEDVSSLEKEPSIDLTEQRLTEAEIARTIAEANGTAILFATLWDDQNHIFGTEVEYIIDDRGDIYFQIDSDSEFLTTLKKAGTKMNVAIGYESIDTWIMEQQEVRDNPIPEEPHEEMSDDEDDDEDDDDDDDNEDSWSIITADGTEYVLDAIIGEKESPEESIGDWSGLDTLASVHPLEFASALATMTIQKSRSLLKI
ncbi:hypothetical protein KP509_31G061000 [Ceratopteris richardii]|uniref:Uncharacterized protein n=1 Tax=Ceratopteris richardii TaxID=49495 RepID=A0A8T2R0E7_CERRI|nr:hypothetical protein KP509_31G061000 [Ceratopteris richardii]